MTQPVTGYRPYPHVNLGAAGGKDQDDKASPLDRPIRKAAFDYCEHASTVAGGFMCGEKQVVLQACVRPNNDIDKTLCDDKKMQAAQTGVWEATKDILKTLFSALIGRSFK